MDMASCVREQKGYRKDTQTDKRAYTDKYRDRETETEFQVQQLTDG